MGGEQSQGCCLWVYASPGAAGAALGSERGEQARCRLVGVLVRLQLRAGQACAAFVARPPTRPPHPTPHLSTPPRPLQLAEIYEQAKEGMYAGSYVPAAMYSCGGHLAGPQLPRRPTFSTATA